MPKAHEQEMRVLVVGDDWGDEPERAGKPADRPAGLKVGRAQGYADALDRLRADKPDVCLVDYRAGDADSLAFVRQARGEGCSAPIILVTPSGETEVDGDFLRESGAVGVISQDDIASDDLKQSLASVLGDSGPPDLFAAAMEEAPDPTFIIDSTGRAKFVNRAAKIKLGFSDEEIEHLHLTDFNPDFSRERWDYFWARIRDQGRLRFEARHRAKDGLVHDVDTRVRFFESGGEGFLCGVSREIKRDERSDEARAVTNRRLRRQNKTLAKLARDKSLHSGDLHEAASTIVGAAAEALEVDRASIWLLSPDRSVIECFVGHGPDFEPGAPTDPIAVECCPDYLEALGSHRFLSATDAAKDERLRGVLNEATGARSRLDAPILLKGALAGFISLETTGAWRDWVAEEQAFAGSMADLVSLALEAEGARTAGRELRQIEARNEAFLQALPDLALQVNREGVILDHNADSRTPIELAEGPIAGLRYHEVLPSPLAAILVEALAQALAFGLSPTLNVRIHRGGSLRFLEMRVLRSGPDEALAIIHDATSRHLAEQRIQQSEHQFRQLAEHLDGVLWMLDARAEGLIYLGPNFEAIMGRDREQLRDRAVNFLRCVHVEDRKKVTEGFARIEERDFDIEHRVVRRNGEVRWVLSRAFLVRDDKGKTHRIVGTCIDITARRRALDLISESERRFRVMANTAPVVLWIAGADGQCEFFNDRWTEFTGRTPEEEIGAGWEDRIHPQDKPRAARRYLAAVRAQRRFELECRGLRHDGEYRWLLASGLPRTDARGQFAGFMGSFVDITDRKQIEKHKAEQLAESRRGRTAVEAILNQMRQGIVMTDDRGRIAFMTESCERLFGRSNSEARGVPWREVFSLRTEELMRLEGLVRTPAAERGRLAVDVQLKAGGGQSIEIEVQDDPRENRRLVFYIYDRSEMHDLRRTQGSDIGFGDLVGRSPSMNHIYDQIRDLAKVDTTVLIEGETGTGKELVARALHETSDRKNGPFIGVNCAGLTDSLLDSQLFGHRRGAFTGAYRDQKGFFEAADGGTLFLDEIGDIPRNVQVRLLRALQEREIIPVGGATARKFNVRVLAATQHDLRKLIKQGSFREDLLYRIRVGRIVLPPLRSRNGDIRLLAETFLSTRDDLMSRGGARCISEAALQRLGQYSWPGNVRELQGAIEYATVHCRTGRIEPSDLPPELSAAHPLAPRFGRDPVEDRDRIIAALEKTHGNRKEAAKLLGISRATFYRRLGNLKTESERL